MTSHRLRIIASLIITFLIVNMYSRLSSTSFANIKIPKLNLTRFFTLRFDQDKGTINNLNQNVDFTTSQPFPTEAVRNGLTEEPRPTDFNIGLINQTPTPTSIPTQTPTPRPTSTPKPTPTPKPPAITTATRPGTSLAEIFQEVEKRLCVPAPLLHAFQTQETGPWWSFNTTSSKVKIYNTYGWWLDGSGNSCTGMGYHTQTGIVPPDAVDAGTRCQNAIPSGADQGIMGILQISQFEQDAAKKYMTGIIKGSIDRRVLFDNAAIFAIITKNRLGTPPKNCSDWPDDAVRTAAEKHYGSCGDNYCSNILKYYKQYK